MPLHSYNSKHTYSNSANWIQHA